MKFPKTLRSVVYRRIFYCLLIVGVGAGIFLSNDDIKSKFLSGSTFHYPGVETFKSFVNEDGEVDGAIAVAPTVENMDNVDAVGEKALSEVKKLEDDVDLTVHTPKIPDMVVAADEVKITEPDAVSFPYTQSFLISAYYSPLPCQAKYVTGSYDGDIRLNGGGVSGADGTPVFSGMIAAPKSYAFGTKMKVSGLGVGAVHDRGGAIISGHSSGYDRLDVWMGYGDEGMKRALSWGKRVVPVTVYGVDSSVATTMSFPTSKTVLGTCDGASNKPAPSEELDVAPKPATEPVKDFEAITPGAHSEDLGVGDSGEAVKDLQEDLISLNLFRGSPNGVYDSVTAHAVFKFQQSKKILSTKSELGAGRFGPQTRKAKNGIVLTRKEFQGSLKKSEPILASGAFLSSELDPGITHSDVGKLQIFLAEQGLFDHAVTNFYGPVTVESVIKFQLKKGIIKSVNDKGAGRIGPGTLAVINSMKKA